MPVGRPGANPGFFPLNSEPFTCLQPRIRIIMHAGAQLTSSLFCCVQFLHQFVGLAGAEAAADSEPNACFNYIMQVYGLQVDSQASILGLPWGLSQTVSPSSIRASIIAITPSIVKRKPFIVQTNRSVRPQMLPAPLARCMVFVFPVAASSAPAPGSMRLAMYSSRASDSP